MPPRTQPRKDHHHSSNSHSHSNSNSNSKEIIRPKKLSASLVESKATRPEKDFLSTSSQTTSTLNLTDLHETPMRADKATEMDFIPKVVRSGEVLDVTPASSGPPPLVVVPSAGAPVGKVRDPTPHFCNLCDKDFHSDFNLKRHIRDYHSEAGNNAALFHCQVCKKNFQNRFNLRRHQTAVHGDDGESFYCDICCTDFHYRDNLRRHLKDVHHQNLPPAPTSPGVSKSQSMALVPARVYTCDICNKDLQNNYNLKRHRQAVHKETKILYGCDECDKDFTTIASYKRHKHMVHGNGKEAFHCEQCNKNFASKDGLKRHILAIHEHFEGDYECEICSKKFLRKENCVKHRKTHDSPYAMVADYELTTVTTSTLL